MENSPKFPPRAECETALSLRIALDDEFRKRGITWRSDRIKKWMQRLSERCGHEVFCVADVPLPAMQSLLRRLQSEPVQMDLLNER